MAFKLSDIKKLFIVEEPVKPTDKTEKKDKKEQKEIKKTETVEEKSEQKSNETKTSKVSWKTNTGVDENSIQSELNTESNTGKLNKKVFDTLTKAIVGANLPGEDYLEYMQALKAMKDLPLEESVKIQTVLATLSTKGLTVQKIYESADYYLEVLNNEKKKFYSAIDSQTQGGIKAKQNQILKLAEDNKKKAEAITRLTDEINKNKEKEAILRKEIEEQQSKINNTEKDFMFTYNQVAEKIRENVDNIRNLKGDEKTPKQ